MRLLENKKIAMMSRDRDLRETESDLMRSLRFLSFSRNDRISKDNTD